MNAFHKQQHMAALQIGLRCQVADFDLVSEPGKVTGNQCSNSGSKNAELCNFPFTTRCKTSSKPGRLRPHFHQDFDPVPGAKSEMHHNFVYQICELLLCRNRVISTVP